MWMFARRRASSLVLAAMMVSVGFSASSSLAAEAGSSVTDAGAPHDTISVAEDSQTLVRSVRIAAPNGKVAWEDIIRVVARLQGFDDRELRDELPKGSLDLKSRFVSPMLRAANRAFAPHIEFRLVHDEAVSGDATELLVTADRESILGCQRELKSEIRASLTEHWPLAQRRQFGLHMDPGWKACSEKLPMVVAVHGYNSDAAHAGELLDFPRKNGLPCGVFDYPNDQAIGESAVSLARELKHLAATSQGRSVVLVTHSMGGVLAREAIENAELNPGNVTRLVMVSPPNQGSQLARFAVFTDVWEMVGGWMTERKCRSVFSAIEDGLGEASVDLEPGSVFLSKLNRRSRNPNVSYSILTGVAAPITAADVDAFRQRLRRLGGRSRWLKFLVSKFDRWLADVDEVIDGRGDGVVSYRRACLAGVDDVLTMQFSHNQPIDAVRTGDAERVHHEIMKRVLP